MKYIAITSLVLASFVQSARAQEVSQPAIPFAARSSTKLVPVLGWQSARPSSPPGVTVQDLSESCDRILTKLQTCSGGS